MRRERIADLVLWLFISAPLLLLPADWPWAAGGWWAVVLSGAALAVCTIVARRRPLLSLATVLVLSLAVPPHFFTPAFSLALAAFGYLTGRRTEHARPALAVFAGMAALGAVAAPLLGASVWLWSWLTLLLVLTSGVVLPWLVGRCVRQYAGLVRSGWELADRMEREQKAVSDQARLRERSRIAGDMHDSLGHELSLIALRAAALEVDPELGQRQQTAARELREAAGMATTRLREIIGVLREEGGAAPTTPVNETVAEAVLRARGSGMTVTLRESGDGPKVPPMTDRAVHRVVQEALTNAAKHARGAAVEVHVVRDNDTVTTTVRNAQPTGPSSGLASGRAGLVGLDERVRLGGGTLSHGPSADGGFMVAARMPLTGTTAAALAPPTPSISQRELEHARRQVRRGLRQAVVAPVAAGAVLALLMFGLWAYTETHSVLGSAAYQAIRPGDRATEVRTRVPSISYEVGPGDVKKPGCVYYRVRQFAPTPLYELCFTEDRLAAKAIVN
jgi:signal transduction histidine kinase